MKQILKSKIKENGSYYYECKPWYDKTPSKLPKPIYQTEIFPRMMSHAEILKTYAIAPYSSYTEALAVVADLIPTLTNDWKGRFVYFKEDDVPYCFRAWRLGDGRLRVYVNSVDLGNKWRVGYGVCFQDIK